MFYFKFFILFIVCLLFIGLLTRLMLIDAPGKTKRVFFFWEFSKKPYFKLQRRINGKIERAFARMKPSSRESKKKEKDRLRSLENLPQRVQRRQREALKSSAYVPLDTCNINLDILVLFIKYLLLFILTIYIYFLSGSLCTFEFLQYNFLPFVFLYLAIHLLITRLVLRHSRFYFWRSWPLLFHRYTEGLLSENYDKTLYLLLLPFPVTWYFLGFLSFFIGFRLFQCYAISRFKRTWGFYTVVYSMAVAGVCLRVLGNIYSFVNYYVRRIRRKLRPVWRFFFPRRKKKKNHRPWTFF